MAAPVSLDHANTYPGFEEACSLVCQWLKIAQACALQRSFSCEELVDVKMEHSLGCSLTMPFTSLDQPDLSKSSQALSSINTTSCLC